MLALELGDDLVKGFMGRLLREDIFSDFKVRSVDVLAKNRFSVNGEIAGGEARDFSMWNDLRPLVFEIVKLMGKPSVMKIVLSHREPKEVHENASALFLNIMYENGKLGFTTATSQKEFALERTLDSAWDEWMRKFFSAIGIAVTDRE